MLLKSRFLSSRCIEQRGMGLGLSGRCAALQTLQALADLYHLKALGQRHTVLPLNSTRCHLNLCSLATSEAHCDAGGR